MRACSFGVSRVKYKVRVGVKNRVDVRVSAFYFLSHMQSKSFYP